MGQLWVKLCRVTVEAYLKPSWMKGNLLKKSLSYSGCHDNIGGSCHWNKVYLKRLWQVGIESPQAALKFLEQLGLDLVIVMHICNPSTWEREVCGSEVEGHPQP